MPAQPTNRDLYLAVSRINTRWQGSEQTLESYLLALWSLARPLAATQALAYDAFVRILDDALTTPAPPYADAARPLPDEVEAHDGFGGWERLILSQIRDLHEMGEAGTLEDEYRYFGANAPRGATWYNFDPASYLEGAAAGTFGGWQAGDGGRSVVPGPWRSSAKTAG